MIGGPEKPSEGQGERVAVRLDGFTAQAADQEADRLGVSVAELVRFSVLYYLADVDSGRIARLIGIKRSPNPELASKVTACMGRTATRNYRRFG